MPEIRRAGELIRLGLKHRNARNAVLAYDTESNTHLVDDLLAVGGLPRRVARLLRLVDLNPAPQQQLTGTRQQAMCPQQSELLNIDIRLALSVVNKARLLLRDEAQLVRGLLQGFAAEERIEDRHSADACSAIAKSVQRESVWRANDDNGVTVLAAVVQTEREAAAVLAKAMLSQLVVHGALLRYLGPETVTVAGGHLAWRMTAARIVADETRQTARLLIDAAADSRNEQPLVEHLRSLSGGASSCVRFARAAVNVLSGSDEAWRVVPARVAGDDIADVAALGTPALEEPLASAVVIAQIVFIARLAGHQPR